MFTLGFNEFIRNVKKNIWVILELVLLFIVGIFMVSTVSEQMRIYKPVRKVLDESGILVYGPAIPPDLFDELKGVENVVSVPMYGINTKNGETVIVSDYPDYRMKLTSGNYCTKGKYQDGVVRAMVCDVNGLKEGDTVELKLSGTDKLTKIYVTGTFGADEWVFGLWRGGTGTDYKALFDSYSNRHEKYMFVANAEDMQREMNDIWYYSFALIDYRDDITEEDIEYNKSVMSETGVAVERDTRPVKEMYINTKKLIEIKTIPTVIAFIIVFIFSIFSIIAASSVSFKYERRNYGIFFLTGNTWKNTLRITLVHWGIEILSALIISVCIGVIVCKLNLLPGLGPEFSPIQICVIAGIIVIQLLMALLIPWRMLRKTEPVTIIKESER